MAALRSSRCRNGDSGSGSGRSLALTPSMNAMTAIARTHARAMIIRALPGPFQSGPCTYRAPVGPDLRQRLRLAIPLHEQPDHRQSEQYRGIRDDPPPRVGRRQINPRAVVADECLDNLLVGHAHRLHLRDAQFGGFEKLHSSILHVATESLHPHWQRSRAPHGAHPHWASRRPSAPGPRRPERRPAEPAGCVAEKTALSRSRLRLNRRRFFTTPTTSVRAYCILTLLGIRHTSVPPISTRPPIQIHETSREHVRLDYRALVVVRHAAEIQVQVLVEPRPDATSEVPCLLAR